MTMIKKRLAQRYCEALFLTGTSYNRYYYPDEVLDTGLLAEEIQNL
jgi:hypothetical protein